MQHNRRVYNSTNTRTCKTKPYIREGATALSSRLRTLYPHRNTSVPNPRAGKEPYLLKEVEIKEVDQVWVSDITYIQIEQRNYYLCVVMDWDSRFVLGWSMGRKMDAGLCLQALEIALKSGRRPRIFNTDQGSQYSSEDWQTAIRAEGIQISMDGKGRWADNIVMERFLEDIQA